MGPVLAVLQAWQAVTLILISCIALVVSLYCLLFMVPLRRFWDRMNSAGGRIDDVEDQVEKMKKNLARRVAKMRENLHEEIQKEARTRERKTRKMVSRLERNTKSMSSTLQKAQKRLEELKKGLKSTRSEVQDLSSDRDELARAATSLGQRLDQLEGEFESLDVELRESVRRRTADSYQQLEARVLSALDTIQDQILEAAARNSGMRGRHANRPRKVGPKSGNSEEKGEKRKIIAAEPLFSQLEGEKRNNSGGTREKDRESDNGGQDSDEPEKDE